MTALKPNVRFSWANQGEFNRGVFAKLEDLQTQITELSSITGGGIPVWGTITGEINSQEDLIATISALAIALG